MNRLGSGGRGDPRSPIANSGASTSGANLTMLARPSRTPRPAGDANATNAQTISAATSESFEFDCSA